MDIFNALIKVRDFCSNFNEYKCISIFGESLGGHIWQKFVAHHHRDFIQWYFDLDQNCRMKIAEAIENA